MSETMTKAPEQSTKVAENESLGSQRVFKKSSPNSMLTLYLPTRELVSCNGTVTPLRGVLHVDTTFVQSHRVYGQLTLTFRYGREDEEVMGLRFCNEAVMCLTQIWPQIGDRDMETLTPLQDALIKRLGDGAYAFSMEINPQAPPSVQLVPAKRYYGAPIGTSYDVRCYVADKSDEKLHRRSTVRMGIRVIHKSDEKTICSLPSENFATLDNNPSQSQSSSNSSPIPVSEVSTNANSKPCKAERADSFSKLKLSPKAFRFTGKLCRSKSEMEKETSDTIYGIMPEAEMTKGPQGAVDKPFLLQDGRVGLRASLDKSVYAHGENVIVTVNVRNDSRKTVRRIRVFAVQHVDVCMFSNGKFKNIVAESDPLQGSDQSVGPGNSLKREYTLHPQRGPTKNWIALEDSLQRSNEPSEINSSIASSALRGPNYLMDEKNVFAIYVSYYVKVKLTLSGMGGELSLKLPFTLAHIDRPDTAAIDADGCGSGVGGGVNTTTIGDKNTTKNDKQLNNTSDDTKIDEKHNKENRSKENIIASIDQIESLSDDMTDENINQFCGRNNLCRKMTTSSADDEKEADLEEVFETGTTSTPSKILSATINRRTLLSSSTDSTATDVNKPGTTFVQIHAPSS